MCTCKGEDVDLNIAVCIAISCCSWQQFYCIIDVVNYTYENNFGLIIIIILTLYVIVSEA